MIEWKDVVGYEGIYKVSSNGEIFSVISGKNLRPVKSSTGYLHVQLYLNHKPKTINVHKIVADAFLPPKDGCPEINHKDGNKANNDLTNLERVSKKENARHAINTGLRKSSPMAGRTGASNPRSKEILQYSLSGEYLRSFYGISEASRIIGCHSSAITACLTGRKKSGANYIWKYKTSSDFPLVIDVPARVYPKGRTWKQKKKRDMHKIQQFTKNGELVNTWENYIELIKKTGFDNGNIYKCINGKIKTAYGYIWRYEK